MISHGPHQPVKAVARCQGDTLAVRLGTACLRKREMVVVQDIEKHRDRPRPEPAVETAIAIESEDPICRCEANQERTEPSAIALYSPKNSPSFVTEATYLSQNIKR
jgi:hypothetical protein